MGSTSTSTSPCAGDPLATDPEVRRSSTVPRRWGLADDGNRYCACALPMLFDNMHDPRRSTH